MKKMGSIFLVFGFMLMVGACKPKVPPVPEPTYTSVATNTLAPTDTPNPTFTPTATDTPVPTDTPEPTFTPTSTPLPGSQVFPIDSFAKEIPWLPLDKNNVPGTNYVAFNVEKPPFNNVLVRQAFSYAIDREAITDMAIRYRAREPHPATVFTPPEVLGRDLYDEVGINFDPQKAKDLLIDAGYTDPSSFPKVTLLVNVSGESAPGARINMANATADMWREYLGVVVNVEVVSNWGNYLDRLANDPPEMYWLGWAADYNDPDNFLKGVFYSKSEYNYGNFQNDDFDRLVLLAAGAANAKEPEKRLKLYIQAERILCDEQAAVIPLYHTVYRMP